MKKKHKPPARKTIVSQERIFQDIRTQDALAKAAIDEIARQVPPMLHTIYQAIERFGSDIYDEYDKPCRDAVLVLEDIRYEAVDFGMATSITEEYLYYPIELVFRIGNVRLTIEARDAVTWSLAAFPRGIPTHLRNQHCRCACVGKEGDFHV